LNNINFLKLWFNVCVALFAFVRLFFQRDQITSNLNGLNTSDSEYKGLIENAFQHL